jgi:hypothetical protein
MHVVTNLKSSKNRGIITMSGITIEWEEDIRSFLKNQGVDVIGMAGPERLDGPPSLDPTYTMRGAKSIYLCPAHECGCHL